MREVYHGRLSVESQKMRIQKWRTWDEDEEALLWYIKEPFEECIVRREMWTEKRNWDKSTWNIPLFIVMSLTSFAFVFNCASVSVSDLISSVDQNKESQRTLESNTFWTRSKFGRNSAESVFHKEMKSWKWNAFCKKTWMHQRCNHWQSYRLTRFVMNNIHVPLEDEVGPSSSLKLMDKFTSHGLCRRMIYPLIWCKKVYSISRGLCWRTRLDTQVTWNWKEKKRRVNSSRETTLRSLKREKAMEG
jgi:hypothetical protein